jgi:tetratricopeptide (TPR) repeat protein
VVEFFEKLATNVPSSPTVQIYLARAYTEWAKGQGPAGQVGEAEKAYRQAAGVLEKLEQEAVGNAESRLELSVVYDSLAEFLGQTAQKQEAEEIRRKAVAINEKLVTDFPNSPDYRASLADRYRSIGDRLKETQPQEAEQAYRRAFALREKLVVDFPNLDGYYRAEYASSQGRLIGVLRKTGQSQEIETVYRQSIARWEKLAAAFPKVPEYRRELARNHNRLGLNLRIAGRAQEGQSELQNAQEYWRAEPDPAVDAAKGGVEAEPKNGYCWDQLGFAYYRAGDWSASLQAMEKAVQIFGGGSGRQWFYLAIAHGQLGHQAEARQWYYRSLDWMMTAQDKDLRDVQSEAAAVLELPDPGDRSQQAWDLSEEGAAYDRQEQSEKAQASYSEAIDVYVRLAADFPAVPGYHFKLAELLTKTGREPEAEAAFRKAVRLNPNDPEPYSRRGQVYAGLEQWDKAAADFAQAIKLKPDEAIAHYWHALSCLRVGDQPGYRQTCASMIQHCAQAEQPETANWVAWTCALAPGAVDDWNSPLRLAELASRSDPKNTSFFSTTLGAALYRAGRIEESIELLEKATKTFEQAGANNPRSSPAYPWFFLALAHQGRGNVQGSRGCLNKATELADRELNNQVPWNRKMTLELLQAEATAAIMPAEKR